MFLLNDWNIQSRGHVCSECELEFVDHGACHTLLIDENREYRRVDLCDACWEANYAESANHRKGFISHWQGTYEAPPENPPDIIERDTAETLLRLRASLQPEIVLYDMPPMLEHDDLSAFLPQLDGVLLISDGTQTMARHLRECERMLEGQVPLLGIVLNRARASSLPKYA